MKKTREDYVAMKLSQLKEEAKNRGLRGISSLNKEALIERLLSEDGSEAQGKAAESAVNEVQNLRHSVPDSKKYAAETNSTEERPAETSPAERRSAEKTTPDRKSRMAVSGNYRMNRNSQYIYNGQPARRQSENERTRREPVASEGERARREPVASENERVRREPVKAERNQTRPEQEAVETEYADYRPELAALDIGRDTKGVLEIPEGSEFGFIRTENYLKGENDIYVSPSQIRRFHLTTGDMITGSIREKTQPDKPAGLLFVKSVNGRRPDDSMNRRRFESLTPVFPEERICMERPDGPLSMRIVDLFAPIGKGQRGLIVSPPKAGKTTLLKEIAHSILYQNPDAYLMVVLIDERPEEVTDFREAIHGENVEVVYSTFDNEPAYHKTVAEIALTRAKRMVELGEDVIILMDSITRLTRAYNLTVQPSGRTLSGGLDPASLNMPKKFFGAARNIRGGGSLTILATALVDTGSKMDDVVYEEFKGTGNMELVLDRKFQERRIFPAIDIAKSGTRREELLLTRAEQEAVLEIRKDLNGQKPEDALDGLLNDIRYTPDNKAFVNQRIKNKRTRERFDPARR